MRCAELRDARAEDHRRRRALIESMFGPGSMPLVESLIATGRAEQPEPDPLSPRREAFCRHYLTEPSGTRAAIMAGYAESGADVQASRLLGNARVLQKISRCGARTRSPTRSTATPCWTSSKPSSTTP